MSTFLICIITYITSDFKNTHSYRSIGIYEYQLLKSEVIYRVLGLN